MPAIDIEIHSQKMEETRYFSLKSLGERGLLLASISVSVLVYPSPCLPGWRYLLPRRDQRGGPSLSLSLSVSPMQTSLDLSRGVLSLSLLPEVLRWLCARIILATCLSRAIEGFFPFPFVVVQRRRQIALLHFGVFFLFQGPFLPRHMKTKKSRPLS